MCSTNFKAELELLKDIMDTMVTVSSKEDTPEDTKVFLSGNAVLIANVFDFIKNSLSDESIKWYDVDSPDRILPLLEPVTVGVDSNELYLDE